MKSWIAWVGAVIVTLIAISFWKNEDVDWDLMIILSIAGLIGTVIGKGIRKLNDMLYN